MKLRRSKLHASGLLFGGLLSAVLLSGCGPRSLAAHIPSSPHIYFRQNTSAVHATPTALLLPLSDLPSGFQTRGSSPGGNDVLTAVSKDPADAAARFERWHRLDGALQTYVKELPSGGGLFNRTLSVQIDVGEYASTADARGWFGEAATTPPTAGVVHALPNPGIAPANIAYAISFPSLSVEQLYFQERNVVVRLIAVGPTGENISSLVATVASQERSRIDAAK